MHHIDQSKTLIVMYGNIQKKLNGFLPAAVASGIRTVATAILTPVRFSAQSGHFWSTLRQKAVDSKGHPLPWYTYPAIHMLQQKNVSGRDVLEFGSGQSTLWWVSRGAIVTSVEENEEWYRSVKASVPASVDLHLIPTDLTGVEKIVGDRTFDVVVVDGLDRAKAACMASDWIKPGGCVILDNSEGFWGPEGTYPIMDHYRTLGFSRVDFYGHAPGVIMRHCTSLFFKNTCFIFTGSENPAR